MNIQFDEAPVAKFVFGNTKTAWFWGIVRIFVGWQWLSAGFEKLTGSGWIGQGSGSALSGFVQGALAKTAGAHPDVASWYGSFLQHIVLPHPALWAHLVTYGELLVGVALIVGAFTGIAAFFGLFMNLNYLLAGTVSVNPILFALSIFLVLAWKVAGYIGIDRYLLPELGTTWQPGIIFHSRIAKDN
jgi:thiosulfate dehydrogenase (quinone) large subunit